MKSLLSLFFSTANRSIFTGALLKKSLLAFPVAFIVNSFSPSQLSLLNHQPTCLFATAAVARAMQVDPEYPGTAVVRMNNIRDRVRSLTEDQLNGDWEAIRRNILWAGGMKDITNAPPGMGYTGHSFNDYNHCDLTAMNSDDADNDNEGRVEGIAFRNPLGKGVRIASIPELGPGGSWSTCMIGCQKDPPQDVAHVQFRSRIAFKLVWVPPEFNRFVLVDDDGSLLATGIASNSGRLPHISERAMNYRVVMGSKYAREADRLAAESAQGHKEG